MSLYIYIYIWNRVEVELALNKVNYPITAFISQLSTEHPIKTFDSAAIFLFPLLFEHLSTPSFPH